MSHHVSKSDEFLMLPLHQVQDLVLEDELEVASEEIVFEAVMSWVKHNEKE